MRSSCRELLGRRLRIRLHHDGRGGDISSRLERADHFRSYSKLKIAAIVLAGLLLLAFGAWEIADSRSYQLFGRIVDRVETDRPLIALTFDDGPAPGATEAILQILAEENVRATFFFTGNELEQHPELTEQYVAAGHEIGNHSFSHKRFLLKSPAFIRSEIERTDSLIRMTGYAGQIHFRPPYGKKLVGLPWYLSRTDRTTIMWDVEPDSYPDVASTSQGIVDHVLENARPGSIILLHVMYPSRRTSLEAVPGIIQGLHELGYEFVTVSELIGVAVPVRLSRASDRPVGERQLPDTSNQLPVNN